MLAIFSDTIIMSSAVLRCLRLRHYTSCILPRSSRRGIALRASAACYAPSTVGWVSPRQLDHPPFLSASNRTLCTVSRSADVSKPKAVIFDLGGVIVPSPQGIFDQFEEKHGLKKGSLVATIKATGNGGSFAKMERGELSIEQFCEPFVSEYLSHTGHKLSLEQAQEFVGQLSDFSKVTPHSEVVEMFGRLKSQGIKVAVLTNNFRWDNGCTVFPQKRPENVDVVCLYVCVNECMNNVPVLCTYV